MALREVLCFFGMDVETKELEKADGLVGQFSDKLIGFGKVVAGAFAIDAVVGFGKALIDQADELREAAIALGAVPQELQKLEFAAGTAGVEMGELRASLQRFNKTAAQSAEGKGAADTFKKLGVEVKNADGTIKSSTQLFEESGAALAKIENPVERAGAASELFGRSYARLLPLFAEGEEGIAKLKTEAEELGFVFDDAFLNQSDEINDNLTKLKKGLTGLAVQALVPLLKDLVAFTQAGVRVVKQVVAWARQTKILQALTVALTTKGVFALVTATGALITRFGGLRAAFTRLLPWILRTLAPLLLLEDLLVFLAGGKSLTGTLLDKAFGPGAQGKVRSFFEEAASGFAKLREDSGKAHSILINDQASWVDRAIAGLALLGGDSGRTFVAIKEGWRAILNDMDIAIDEFVVGTLGKWNAMIEALFGETSRVGDLFKSSTAEFAEKDLAKRKAFRDELQRRAYERETGTGAFEPPEAKKAREANTGVDFMRPDGQDLSPAQKATADWLEKARFGGGPGGGPWRIDEPAAPSVVAPTKAVAPIVAPITNNNVNNSKQTAQITVQVTGDVKPATANRVGRAAKDGAMQAFDNLRATQAALVSQAG